MGNVTFTLEWRADVDLDLWFICQQNSEKVYYSIKNSHTCKSMLDVDMRESKQNNQRATGDFGQLENLYVKVPYNGNQKFAINWYSGKGQSTNYKVFVTRQFCGKYLDRRYESENDRCQFDIVGMFDQSISTGQTHYYTYIHDPDLKYENARQSKSVSVQ